MINFKLRGVAELRKRINEIVAQFPDRVGKALYQEGQVEMTESKKRCPVWNPKRPLPPGEVPGALRASGQVHEPEYNGNRVSVTLSYGDAAVDYAVYVHEDLDAHHAIGQAKYLESVLNESLPHMAERLGKRLDLRDR